MQTISNLETGRLRDLKVSTLSALANSLGVPLYALYGESDGPDEADKFVDGGV